MARRRRGCAAGRRRNMISRALEEISGSEAPPRGPIPRSALQGEGDVLFLDEDADLGLGAEAEAEALAAAALDERLEGLADRGILRRDVGDVAAEVDAGAREEQFALDGDGLGAERSRRVGEGRPPELGAEGLDVGVEEADGREGVVRVEVVPVEPRAATCEGKAACARKRRECGSSSFVGFTESGCSRAFKEARTVPSPSWTTRSSRWSPTTSTAFVTDLATRFSSSTRKSSAPPEDSRFVLKIGRRFVAAAGRAEVASKAENRRLMASTAVPVDRVPSVRFARPVRERPGRPIEGIGPNGHAAIDKAAAVSDVQERGARDVDGSIPLKVRGSARRTAPRQENENSAMPALTVVAARTDLRRERASSSRSSDPAKSRTRRRGMTSQRSCMTSSLETRRQGRRPGGRAAATRDRRRSSVEEPCTIRRPTSSRSCPPRGAPTRSRKPKQRRSGFERRRFKRRSRRGARRRRRGCRPTWRS
mmetsp:Transcript_4353/g.13572  ORF Transcript_4353/g.13572 Transcript_4353/m.13572 type:complete len:479 (+) Transcript_4353:299-1735(+)